MWLERFERLERLRQKKRHEGTVASRFYGRSAGALFPGQPRYRSHPLTVFGSLDAYCGQRWFRGVGWKSADMSYQRLANPVQSGASVPVTFVPGPRAPKTERVP